ncbi:hypothetical protein D7V97_24305 [Corallococcus sp. CA053C]|uniref:hypothetical protein n=1 Tax=Corallococcus sp. CA053C TaxID=2316732 RepID=UPI000EA39061|nr:hypothetical protein [Corallococcus sp. CA053C]RKH05242.1 hypothetical protein D7V97_24305 [Corallococcus sp. CA053C]
MKKALFGAALFLGVGCGGEALESPTRAETETPAATETKGLLTSVRLTNGNVVEFYEMQPGEVIVTEAGQYPNPPAASVASLAPVEAYRELTGGRDVPAALAAAQARLEAARAKAPSVPLQAQGPVEGVPTQAAAPQPGGVHASAGPCDLSWFQDNFCLSGYDYQMCLTNWWGGAWVQINGADYHYSAVCPFSGSVVMEIAGQGIWSVPQGGYRWASRSASNFTFRTDITHATNSGFQFASNVNY